MASVSGPVSTLPGHVRSLSSGHTCDTEGCSKPALYRAQGETDSFGAEYEDFCEEHYREYCEGITECSNLYYCDHCKREAECKPCRDPGEGLCGPVYYLCEHCRAVIKPDYDDLDD